MATTSDGKYEIPAPSRASRVLPDPNAGFVYIITTTVSIEQVRIDMLKQKVQSATQTKQAAETVIAELQPQIDAIDAATLEVSPIK